MSSRTRSLVCLAGGAVLVLSTWFSTAAALPGLRTELGLSAGAARWVGVGLQLGFAAGAFGLGAPRLDRPRPLPHARRDGRRARRHRQRRAARRPDRRRAAGQPAVVRARPSPSCTHRS